MQGDIYLHNETLPSPSFLPSAYFQQTRNAWKHMTLAPPVWQECQQLSKRKKGTINMIVPERNASFPCQKTMRTKPWENKS